MAYPPLLQLSDINAYRSHFETVYCRGPITTFDGIMVRFGKADFDHCCFESSKRNSVKDTFSPIRAERLDWIGATLRDPDSERFVGWDHLKKRYDHKRRVAVVMGDYVVVIALTGTATARFITAYVADTRETINKIRMSPRWA